MERVRLPEALEKGLEWQPEAGAVIVHVVSSRGTTSIPLDAKFVLSGDDRSLGSIDVSIDASVRAAAKEALDNRRSRLYSLHPTAEGGAIVGRQGGEVDVFAEVLPPVLSLVIVGAGHIAQPLSVLGKLLGFSVTVIDDRPEFANRDRFPDADEIKVMDFTAGLAETAINQDTYAVLVTRGHVHDHDCLRVVLETKAGYIGMIGSKMRIRTVMRSLKREGFSREQLNRVWAPIGIDIGSHTPPEIALAIAAEIVDLRRGGKSPHLTLTDRLGD